MIVLIDLNIVLDVILNRQAFFPDSKAVWDASLAGQFDGRIAATELTNLYYIVTRQKDEPTARAAVDICLMNFSIVAVDGPSLLLASQMGGCDFEDNVVIACAESIAADYIVTRDETGFAHSTVLALSPVDFLAKLTR